MTDALGSHVDVHARTTLVCGVLALTIAAGTLLRSGRFRRVHGLFVGLASLMGLWYISQALYDLGGSQPWATLRIALSVPLPVLAVHFFEAMVAGRGSERWRASRLSLFLAVPVGVLSLSPGGAAVEGRMLVLVYAVSVVALGLMQMAQRGRRSRSRATRERVQFLVVVGAFAGIFTITDFVFAAGLKSAAGPPPVGAVLSMVFLFMLAQALRHDRLLDLYEVVGRTIVATAVAFLIAGVFYILVTVVGQFNTMWLNAIVVAIVVLVLFNPLRDWVEVQIQRLVFRDAGRLPVALRRARRRLAHTLELDDMAHVTVNALERSRRFTSAGVFALTPDGSRYELLGSCGEQVPTSIEVATAAPLLEGLRNGPVLLEDVRRRVNDAGRDATDETGPSGESVLVAAGVLGDGLRERAVVLGAGGDDRREPIVLLVTADDRYEDALSPDDVAQLEELMTQLGVVVENSRVYAKMKERDRLAVLGQMAAGLAHEIRNPLGAIKGAAQLLSEPEDRDTQTEFIGIILEEVERLDDVVRSVLDLAKNTSEHVLPIDVNANVRRTVQLLQAEWAETEVDVDEEFDPHLPEVVIDPTQLRQVLFNLMQNAAQAMKGRGRVSVKTRMRRRGDANWVTVSVSDEGPGISRAALKNIFLPFFTTKEEGTGLGLALSQRMVQRAGGRIDVSSREGEGTTFHIVLPAAEAVEDALATPTPSAELRRRLASLDSSRHSPRRPERNATPTPHG